MIKSIRTKINRAIIIALLTITTLMSCKAYAAVELPEAYQNGKMVTHNSDGEVTSDLSDYSEGAEFVTRLNMKPTPIKYSDYLNNAYLFCSALGVRLPNPRNYEMLANILEYKYPEQGEDLILTETEYNGLQYDENHEIIMPAYYAKVTDKICTPDAAYIMSHLDKNKPEGISNDYNHVQIAWWKTDEGQENGENAQTLLQHYNAGKATEDNMKNGTKLYNTAVAYEDFVKKIAQNVDDVDSYKTLTHTYSNGETVTIPFPELKENKINSTVKFNKAEDIKVSFDKKEQKYLIGPMSINYIESSTQCSDENGEVEEIEFGSIEKIFIYTDATGDSPLEKGQYWDFVYTEARNEGDTSEYPHANEEFYIKLDYIEGATKLTKIDAKYRYLIAGAQYQVLTGNYDKFIWSPEIVETDDGIYYKLTSGDKYLTEESQTLALTNKYARWYETMIVSADFAPEGDKNEKEGKISITKKAVDKNGNELTAEQIKEMFGEYQYFNFKVKVKYDNKTLAEDIVRVKAGADPVIKTYTWSLPVNPYFEVEELDSKDDQWEIESFEVEESELVVEKNKVYGYLKEGTTPIKIIAKNTPTNNPHEQTISLTKKISGKAEEEENFFFDVTVTMPDGTKKQSEAKITIPKGQEVGNTWVSEKYIWYGKNKPEYEIVENMSKGDAYKYPNTSITPSKGKLDGRTATFDVNAYNSISTTEHNGYLEIEKVLKEGQVTDEEFKFNVKVEGVSNTVSGTDEFSVMLKAGETAGPYKYTWDGDKAPTFTVKENDSVEVKDVSIDVTGGKNVNKSGKTVTGQLSEGNDAKIKLKYKNDMEEHKGKIKVYKEIYNASENDKEVIASEGKIKFDISISIKGTFVYEGKTYENTIGVISKSLPDEGNWSFETDDIVWYGSETPTYVVSETNLPEGWKCRTISYGDLENKSTDSEGHALVDGKTVEATVTNSDDDKKDKKGYVNVTKKAYDEQNKELSEKEIKEKFGEDQYFDFRIKITHSDGTVEYDTKTVKAGTTLKVGPYTWKENENAPSYEIGEISNMNESWELVSIENEKGSLDNEKTANVVIKNKIKNSHEQTISLTKKISGKAEEEENFFFDVTVTMPDGTKKESEAKITIPKGQEAGNTWVSDKYIWYGENKPEYEIVENMKKGDASKYPNTSITPAKGKLDGTTATFDVNAYNSIPSTEHTGVLEIEKVLEEGQVTDEEFEFNVKVEGVSNTVSGTDEFSVMLKAGEKAGPYKYVWTGNEAPTFTVTETDSSEIKKVSMEVTGGENIKKSEKTVTGQLSEKNNVNISAKFMNDMNKHSGKIKVNKEIYTELKINKDTIASEGKIKFDIKVVIEGTFIYNGKTYQNSSAVITKTLPDNGNWSFETEDIIWYGSKAPTFWVEEYIPETAKKQGWKLKSIMYTDAGESNADKKGYSLIDNKTINVDVLNELPLHKEVDLTFSMGGITWVDNTIDEKNNNENGYYSRPNGVYDEKYDTLKENVEVYVYKVIYNAAGEPVGKEIATAYMDENKNKVEFPIVTKTDGKWFVPRMPVAVVTEEQKEANYTADYDVMFVYDGQTYEPTEFLSYQIGLDGTKTKNEGSNEQRAKNYKSATTSGRDKYAKDSMALEDSNENDSRIFAEISGKTEIDSNGDTKGTATLTDGSQVTLNYHSDNAGSGYPTVSKLITTDENGKTLDIFKAVASTSAGTLTYPFVGETDGSSLTNIDQYVDEDGVHRKYQFTAVYNHCLNINLGLKQKASLDFGLTKNLDNAKVVVKEKMYEYKYSGYFDLTEEKVNSLDKNIQVKDANESTKIEYTLGLYKSDYYYRAEMYKNGANTTVYDALENFYKTIDKSIEDTEMDVYLTYKIKIRNNDSAYSVKVNSIDDYYDSSFTLVRAQETKYLKTKTIGGVVEEVNKEYQVAQSSEYADKWVDVKTGIVGSDKDANGDNIIYNKMTANGLDIVLEPGAEKEILVTFKVTKENSADAKNAIKLGQKCNVAEISSYTTYYAGTDKLAGKIDRDSAPGNLNITTYNEKAWYEDDTFAAPRIRVTVDGATPERTINGIAWEDNSKDKNTENPGYNQKIGNGVMDSNEKTIEGLKTELVEKVIVQNADNTFTEYNYSWPTDIKIDALNGKTFGEVTGLNCLTNTDADGKYTFRGVPTGSYVVRFTYGDKKIETVGDSSAEFYNGQDFKSTQFKADLKNGTKVRADSNLDIDKINAYSQVKNTALDSEIRRLEVVAKSREITNKNGTEMADYEGTKLYDEYYMFADTPKLDLNIELSSFGSEGYKYDVNNVSFGIEERPETEITLDKQIEEMTLTTSDGRTIMSAKYTIDYKVADDGKITAKVELDKENCYGITNLQELNRDQAVNKGFRYINIDSSILEGTTLNIKYRFTVLNTGEVDRTGKLAEENINFNDACMSLSSKLATFEKVQNSLTNNTTMGDYVGNIYYYGKGDTDKVVTTTVRQLVDYIDNDAQFSGMMNSTENSSWSNVTVEELKEFIAPQIVKQDANGNDIIKDASGILYETEKRNNLAVSVDNNDKSSELNNSGLIVELVPHNASDVERKPCLASMNLTISRYVSAEMDDLQVDNVAEIIKYNNKVGRKDKSSIPGNYDPSEVIKTNIILKDGTVSSGLVYEKDTSATEVITMSPPTGAGLSIWKLQLIATISVGLVIIAGGIVIIKKKILK